MNTILNLTPEVHIPRQPVLWTLSVATSLFLASTGLGQDAAQQTEKKPGAATEQAGQRKTAEVDDRAIATAVEKALAKDSAVRADGIDVAVNGGNVALSGSVGSLLAKDRAAKIVSAIHGVREVTNSIEVSGAKATDAEIQRNVELQLFFDAATDSYEIKPAVSEGIVTLSGTVQSNQERSLAAHVTKGVKGVRGIKNQIEVSYKADRSDSEIIAEIKGSIDANPWLSGQPIDTKVQDGAVTINGRVPSVAIREQAIAAAWTAGVKSVDAQGLKIDPDLPRTAAQSGKKRSDMEIKNAVEAALILDPRVISSNAEVRVREGKVTLTGVVENAKAKRAAERVARSARGVSRVENLLKVRMSDRPSDKEIAENIRAAFGRDVAVDGGEVHVNVRDGVVTLRGDVDTFYERSRAEDIASRSKGVIDVQNSLQVEYPVYTFYDFDYDPYWSYDPYYSSWTYDRPPAHSTWPYTSDAETADDIQDELFWSPFVDADEVAVTVQDGRATLTGTVDSWQEYRSATENAYEGGAWSVTNRLQVE